MHSCMDMYTHMYMCIIIYIIIIAPVKVEYGWILYEWADSASENTAHEYNIQPYSTFTSVIIITHFFYSHMFYQLPHVCMNNNLWRHTKYRLVSVAANKPCQPPIPCVRTYCSTGWSDIQTRKIYKAGRQ